MLMPSIKFAGKTILCERGENLRSVLMQQKPSLKSDLYNGISTLTHCRGLGTCGTCAVQVEGPLSPMTKIEKWRLGFPPHRSGTGLRLACQASVLGDLVVNKHSGMWGQCIAEQAQRP